jgi:hypothetical protein
VELDEVAITPRGVNARLSVVKTINVWTVGNTSEVLTEVNILMGSGGIPI